MSDRRRFLQQSSALIGGATLASAINNSAFAIFNNPIPPSDQVNIGAIGINGMGWSNVVAALKVPGVNLVAVCDVDATKVKSYSNYKQLLEQKDVDAVIIGTPDHWHALIMMDACQAGKDVYVEKPVGNSIGECRAMVAAQKKYNRVVQAGQWQRS